jgi:hypothetical protein
VNTHLEILEQKLKGRDVFSPVSILVPSQVQAEAITRHFVDFLAKPELLFNARFFIFPHLIREIHALTGFGALSTKRTQDREILLWQLFSQKAVNGLEYFLSQQLSQGTGYAQAFASTIQELDLAGVDVSKLEKMAVEKKNKRFSDIAKIWSALEKIEDPRILSQGTAVQKALLLLKDVKVKAVLETALGAVYWIADGFEDFLFRTLGDEIISAIPRSTKIEIAKVADYGDGFKRVEKPTRILEAWSGIEEELKSTVTWLHDSLQEEPGASITPDIAVLCSGDLQSKLQSHLTHKFPGLRIYTAHGISATETADGARILALLDALAENLSCESMIRILPWFYLEEENVLRVESGRTPLSRSDWLGAIHESGVVGGNLAHSNGYDEWCDRLFKYIPLAKPHEASFKALIAITKKVVDQEPLAAISEALFEFLKSHLRLPSRIPIVAASLRASIESICENAWSSEVSGGEALRTIRETLNSIRIPSAAIGDARVFLGSINDAMGLPFRAIRLVGVCEGVFPSSPREDAILPDEFRRIVNETLGYEAIRLSEDLIRREKTALSTILAFQPKRFVVSHAAQATDGGQRAESSLYLDIFYSGYSGNQLEKDLDLAFAKNRTDLAAEWASSPVHSQDLVRAIRHLRSGEFQPVPIEWGKLGRKNVAFKCDVAIKNHMLKYLSTLTPYDGVFIDGPEYAGIPFVKALPGLSEETPLHPSGMGKMLDCPQRFFYEQILNWRDIDTLQDRGSMNVMTRGTMIHKVIEKIYSESQTDQIQRMSDSELRELTIRNVLWAFSHYGHTNFLGQGEARKKEVDRVQEAILSVLRADRASGAHEVQSEVAIKARVELPNSEYIFIEGTTDRLEYIDSQTRRAKVVDFKSGRGKDTPDYLPSYDMQVVAYYRGLAQMGLIGKEGLDALEFRYPENQVTSKRVHEGPRLAELLRLAEGWLGLIHQSLSARFFPKTTNPENCKYCSFLPLCGVGHSRISEEKLVGNSSALSTAYMNLWSED